MRRTFVVVATALLLVLTALPTASAAPPAPELQRVIVQLDPDGVGSRLFSSEMVTRFGGNRGFVFEHAINGFVAELPQRAIDALSRHPSVISITPDRIVATIAAQQPSTGWDRAEADQSPAAPTAATDCPAGETCTNVDIAILDTGSNNIDDLNVVQRTDCSGIILPGFGSCQNGSGADGNGHGTFVAGVAAAFDNGIGTVGVAPGARVHSVKVLSDEGSGFLSAIIAGVDWVTARADVIDVVNMSLTGEFSDATLNTAIANSVDAGVVYAVASGNDGVDAATYSPASHPDVITVSAIADADGGAGGLSGITCREGETDDAFASFSNFGEDVDIAAPGVCITSVWNDGSIHIGSGTSAAAPFVAGAAGKYIAINGRDVTGDTTIDQADADAVKAALLGDAHAQADACGFTGDPDPFPEPLLFVNGPAFGGDGTCDVIPPDLSPPTAPGSLTATANGFPIDLGWTPAEDPDTGILEYRIYRDTVPTSGEILLATAGAAATTYTDEDTSGSTTYRYEVTAVNFQFGESARSNPAEATTTDADPTDAGWWTLDDGTGTTAADSTAWQRGGTLVNGPAWTAAGKVAGALDFDGNDDRVDLDAAVLDGFGDVTFATWIKTTKTGTQALISGANSGNANEFLFQIQNDTTLRFYTGFSNTAGVQWSMDSIADGAWHHLALVRNDGIDRVTAYRDGMSLGTWGLTEPMDLLDIDALVIGQDQDSVGGGFSAAQAFDGALDEVRVYTRLLAQSEIDALALRDLTPPTAPPTLVAVANGSSVDLGWGAADDPESGITEYEIWRGSGVGVGTPTTLWTTVPGTQTTYRDTAVQPATPYVYEVVAVNGGDISGPASPTASVDTNDGDAGLRGWWALDDATGTAALDWSTYAFHGSLAGDPVWTSGPSAGALTFDGVSDLVDLPASALDGADDVTLSLWFQTTKDGIQAMVSGANAGNDAEIELIPISATNVRFYTGEANTSFVSWTVPSIATGAWHHIAVTRDGTNDQATLYLDGTSYGAKAKTITPLSIATNGLVLGQEQDSVGGGYSSSQAFVGSMDEVRFYDRVLSASEIADLAGLGVPTLDTTAPAAPTGLTTTAGDGTVALDWADNAEPDLATYTVHRAETSGGPYSELVADLSVSDHLDTTVVNGTAYFYVVTATDTSGNESVESSEAAATPQDTTAPVAPTGLSATAGDSQVTLDWDDNAEPDLASYTLYRSADGGPYAELASGLVTSGYLDDTAGNDTPYSYVVTATDTVGNESAQSAAAEATPGDTTAPAAPIGLLATPGDGQVSLDWDDNAEPDVATYTVYRSEMGGVMYVAIASDLTSSDYVDSTAVNDTTYFYVVTATDLSGNESGDSNEASATPQDITPPAAPSGLVATAGDGLVDLDWADNGDPDLAMYLVYRASSTGGPYTEIDSVTDSVYTDTSVVNGTAYFYVVAATDTSGNESADSHEATATPQDATPPASPTGLAATPGDGEVTLDWSDNVEPDFDTYTVYRSTTSGSGYTAAATDLTDSAFVDATVINGTTYYYVVTATDTNGNESADSAEAAATPQAPSVSYADLVAADGAYAWWRLGETSGTTAFDAAGSHDATYRNGVALGAPGLIAGDPDTAATFDGANDYIAVPDAADINTGGPYGARTVELWFNADDVTSRQVLYEEGGATRGIAVYLDGGQLYFNVWNRKNDDGGGAWGPIWVSTPVTIGTTYHAVLVFDAGAGTLEGYLNGASVGSQSGVRNLYKHGANIGIGAMNGATYFHNGRGNGTGYYFDGTIDEVALYATPLTAAQVQAHWESGSAG